MLHQMHLHSINTSFHCYIVYTLKYQINGGVRIIRGLEIVQFNNNRGLEQSGGVWRHSVMLLIIFTHELWLY